MWYSVLEYIPSPRSIDLTLVTILNGIEVGIPKQVFQTRVRVTLAMPSGVRQIKM